MEKSKQKGLKNIGLAALSAALAVPTGGVSLMALPTVMSGTDALIGNDSPELKRSMQMGLGNPDAGYSTTPDMPKDFGLREDVVEPGVSTLETLGQLSGSIAGLMGSFTGGNLPNGNNQMIMPGKMTIKDPGPLPTGGTLPKGPSLRKLDFF